ncbi:MAG: DUF1134 domain-containing protein [Alphaproteobacteria bacterium]|nr:MAG: DUF1134 domain-containing protein [Alphaproteobacteria bacterium]
MLKFNALKIAAAAGLAALAFAPAAAQQTQDSGWQTAGAQQPAAPGPQASEDEYQPVDAGPQSGDVDRAAPAPQQTPIGDGSASSRANMASAGGSVPREDVFSAAEGVFGKGAAGLGDLIAKLLREQGEPSAYITGREAGGAFAVGVRYGSGTLHHQVEGDRPVYWTGPSLGFDFGADANKVFVLVYNLYDSQRLFRRYPAAEGNAYVVGGFTASYMRRGDIVLIPVRLGVGARLGVNAGYMRFSEKNRWLPF